MKNPNCEKDRGSLTHMEESAQAEKAAHPMLIVEPFQLLAACNEGEKECHVKLVCLGVPSWKAICSSYSDLIFCDPLQ